MRPRPVRLAAVAAALALAGCGASESSSANRFQGTEREVAQTVEDLQRAGLSRDAEKICSEILSRELVRQIEEGGTCAGEVEQAITEAGDFELRVTDVTIQGDRATAEVQPGSDRERAAPFELVRQDGRWRVDAFGGS